MQELVLNELSATLAAVVESTGTALEPLAASVALGAVDVALHVRWHQAKHFAAGRAVAIIGNIEIVTVSAA